MERTDLFVGGVAILLPFIFVSIFKYRIAGSNAGAVAVGGIALSAGVVVVVYHLSSSIFDGHSGIDAVPITVGSVLITAIVYGMEFGFTGTAYSDWGPVLAVVATVAIVTFLVGNKIKGELVDGLQCGFLTAGVSGVFCVILVTHEAITREIVFNALVAISSVTIPLFLGAIGAVFGLFGNSFARRRTGFLLSLRE